MNHICPLASRRCLPARPCVVPRPGINSGAFQCLTPVPGTTYNAGTSVMVPSGGAQGQAFMQIAWTDGLNCTGNIIRVDQMFQSGAFDTWENMTKDNLVAPPGAKAVEVYAQIVKNFADAKAYKANYDKVYLSPAPAKF
jgi:hypothetical protein